MNENPEQHCEGFLGDVRTGVSFDLIYSINHNGVEKKASEDRWKIAS